MKKVKRTNTTMVNLQQQAGFILKHDLYAIDVDIRRNCYNCGGFGHITRNYRKEKQSRKQEFKLKRIKRPIYMRNIDSFFNKE